MLPTWLGLRATTIHRMLQHVPLDPERIAKLVEAYQIALKKLGMVHRDDPMIQMVAKKVIEIGQTGVRDPNNISDLAVKELGSI
jgi:DNA-directed RNA polymerase subunit H (RpoH/RPB5)